MSWKSTLHHYFQDLEKEELFSGVVLITQGNSFLYSGAFGSASRPWKIANTLDTRFDTASVTKLFTSLATLQLIDQGLFDFETRVIDFLKLKGTTISKEVNVYHLLTHTSGIGDDSEEEAGEVMKIYGKRNPIIRSQSQLISYRNLSANLPTSLQERAAGIAIVVMCCWG